MSLCASVFGPGVHVRLQCSLSSTHTCSHELSGGSTLHRGTALVGGACWGFLRCSPQCLPEVPWSCAFSVMPCHAWIYGAATRHLLPRGPQVVERRLTHIALPGSHVACWAVNCDCHFAKQVLPVAALFSKGLRRPLRLYRNLSECPRVVMIFPWIQLSLPG